MVGAATSELGGAVSGAGDALMDVANEIQSNENTRQKILAEGQLDAAEAEFMQFSMKAPPHWFCPLATAFILPGWTRSATNASNCKHNLHRLSFPPSPP